MTRSVRIMTVLHLSSEGASESQLSPAYVEHSTKQPVELGPAPESRTRGNCRRQKRSRRRSYHRPHTNTTTASRHVAPRHGHRRRRRTRTSPPRPCRKRGFSERLNPSACVRAVHKFNSVIVTTRFRSMHIPVSIRTSNAMANIKALVDSGATDCFMSKKFIRQMKLGKQPLQRPRKIWIIDNTANQAGDLTHYLALHIHTRGIRKTIHFLVTNIGNEDIILGYAWMA